jgi:cell division topological specificity factor
LVKDDVGLLNYFRTSRQGTAKIAKERLQIVIAHERGGHRPARSYLPLLQQEVLQVIRRYVQVADEHVKIQVERDGKYEILEVNITLPD